MENIFNSMLDELYDLIIIEQNKCRSTLKITNDETFEEATVMLQTEEEANTLMYNLLRGIIKGEN